MATRAGSQTILDEAIATGVSESKPVRSDLQGFTIQAHGLTSAGAGSAEIIVEVSNDATPPTAAAAAGWITAGTITLTLSTTRTDDGLTIVAKWRFVRVRLSAISGTDATVSVEMGG